MGLTNFRLEFLVVYDISPCLFVFVNSWNLLLDYIKSGYFVKCALNLRTFYANYALKILNACSNAIRLEKITRL